MTDSRRFKGVSKNGYNPSTYVSVQDRVNNNPEFRRQYFEKMANEGWEELQDPSDILKLQCNTQIKYIVSPHKRNGPNDFGFRSGGFYQRPGENRKFVYFKGFNKSMFTLQFNDIDNLYVKQAVTR